MSGLHQKLLVAPFIIMAPAMAIAQKGSIKGIVADETGPLPGVVVVAENTGFHALTDINGRFELVNLPAKTYELRFSALGYELIRRKATVTQGVTDLSTIAMKSKAMKEFVVRETLRPSESKAINMMKTAATVVNVVSSEGVAKLPDRNVAEAVQRLPGVVMETDQGEGRFISFRGTPSDWSSALINGDRMPVADEESKSRAMNFDIFPSSLIDYIVVAKSLSPDMEGDAIGGSANFITKNAPVKRTLQASAGGGYNMQAGKPIYNANFTYGDRSKNKKFGFLLGGSVYNRNWATDNYQVHYGGNTDHALTRLELRDYEGNRLTLGFNGAMEYKINSNHKLYAKGMYGSMKDDEYNRKTMYNWSTGVGQSIKLQNIHDIMLNRFWGGELGGESKLNTKLMAKWRVATYHNQFKYGNVNGPNNDDPTNGYYVAEFEKPVYFTDFLYLDDKGKPTDEYNASYRAKLLGIDSPIPGYGDDGKNIQPTYRNIIPVTPTDTMFAFTRAYSETNRTYEKDPIVAQLDLQYKVNNQLDIKVGGKLRTKQGERVTGMELWERNKKYPAAIVYDNYNPQPVNERGGFLQELSTPYKGQMFPFLTNDALNQFTTNLGDTLTHRPFGYLTPYYQQFVGSSYKYKENVYAAYVMADWRPTEKLSVTPGIRAEYTTPEVTADTVVTIDPATGGIEARPVRSGKNYLSLLPMVNARYALTETQNLRAAVTRTFRRPNFNEIKPGAPAIDYSNFDLLYGNPDLRPTYSWNFDAAYEKYFGSTGMVSAGAFYKHVKDHIYTAFESSSTDNTGIQNEFQIPGGVIAKKFQNAPESFAAGFELSLMLKMDFLPGFLKNFGVNANYTYTYSEMKIAARKAPQPLPRQSPNVANVAVFYESNKLMTRLALNYRDPYLYELNLYAVSDPKSGETIVVHQDNDYDMFIGKSMSLDYSITYRFTKRLAAFAEANNLLNTPYLKYRGRADRPVKTEYYSIRGLVGVKFEL